jgi:hypothetical protein
MRRVAVLAFVISLFAGSCLPAPATDIPAASVDLEGTAAVFVQQTLEALPSITSAPSNTPVMAAETATSTTTATRTVSAGTFTTTPTLTSGTAVVVNLSGTPLTSTGTAISSTPTQSTVIATETLHTRFYGTLPPQVAHNSLELVNKSKAEAYISLQVTVADGSTTILEYPVGGLFAVQAPVGKYKYVAWVGGNKIVGSFTLGSGNGLRITIYKDRIEVKKR